MRVFEIPNRIVYIQFRSKCFISEYDKSMQLWLIMQVATINVAWLPWENTNACGLLAAFKCLS